MNEAIHNFHIVRLLSELARSVTYKRATSLTKTILCQALLLILLKETRSSINSSLLSLFLGLV